MILYTLSNISVCSEDCIDRRKELLSCHLAVALRVILSRWIVWLGDAKMFFERYRLHR